MEPTTFPRTTSRTDFVGRSAVPTLRSEASSLTNACERRAYEESSRCCVEQHRERATNQRERGFDVEEITGELIGHRVVGEDFWSIGTVRVASKKKRGADFEDFGGDDFDPCDGDTVAITGKLLGVHVGDSLRLKGKWTTHKKYGPQFKVIECHTTRPQDENGTIAWLSSHRLPNVGPSRARAMLDHFGGADALWEVIENEPERLAEVKGISANGAGEIGEAYLRFVGDRDRMIRFRSWGMTENQIAKVVKKWGDAAEEKLRANPYQLAEVVDGFGFILSDGIAVRMGLPRNSDARIDAGLVHTMRQATGHGHCYVSSGKLVNIAAKKVLRVDGDLVAKRLVIMKKSGRLVQHGERVFTRRLNDFEKQCADAIRALLEVGGAR